MAALIIEFSERHGMIPNLKPKKTAIVLALRGKGARQVRTDWFPAGKKVVTLPVLGRDIYVAPSYVHLGGLDEDDPRSAQTFRDRESGL